MSAAWLRRVRTLPLLTWRGCNCATVRSPQHQVPVAACSGNRHAADGAQASLWQLLVASGAQRRGQGSPPYPRQQHVPGERPTRRLGGLGTGQVVSRVQPWNDARGYREKVQRCARERREHPQQHVRPLLAVSRGRRCRHHEGGWWQLVLYAITACVWNGRGGPCAASDNVTVTVHNHVVHTAPSASGNKIAPRSSACDLAFLLRKRSTSCHASTARRIDSRVIAVYTARDVVYCMHSCALSYSAP